MTGSNTQIVKEYASALFELGIENDSAKEILSGLELVNEVFRSTPDFYVFLDAPAIPMSERIAALQDTFSEDVPEYVVSFLCILCRRGTVDLFPACAEEYEMLYNDRLRMAHAFVVSAVELTEDEKERLDRSLEKRSGKQVDIIYKVDPSLLGGMTVELDGVIIDGSLRGRLKTIKEVMDK